jgi:hypothetical protein
LILPDARGRPPRALFDTHLTIRLDFRPMGAMDGGARRARGLETRGNDGFGESSPEVRGRTALESRAISARGLSCEGDEDDAPTLAS